MSAGPFTLSRYLADNGQVKPIRIQPETIGLTLGTDTNIAPVTPVTSGATFARVSGGNRRYGTKARSVTLRFSGAVPDGYTPNAILRVPVLQPAVWDAVSAGGTGQYLGSPVVVVGKSAERSR